MKKRLPLPEKRCLTQDEAAQYIGMSGAWLSANLERMQLDGFPVKHAITGRYDRLAIDEYLDRKQHAARPLNRADQIWGAVNGTDNSAVSA